MTSDKEIRCKYTSIAQLFSAYMPFIINGGLFVPVNDKFSIGEHVKLEVELLDDSSLFKVSAEVIWITPAGAPAGKPSGIGLQFLQGNSEILHSKIETLLAGMLQSTTLTHTM